MKVMSIFVTGPHSRHTYYMSFCWSCCWLHGNQTPFIAEVQDPIRLKHFSLCKIPQKIDMMEGEYDIPMRFDNSRIPSVPTAAGQNIGEWGYGVAVYGAAKGHHQAQETPSLMADIYGFGCE